MAKKFKDLRSKMSPESQVRMQEKTALMLKEMPLSELRQARKFSQEQLANILDVKQPAVAKIEKRTDMYITTLRRFIEAMGGNLEIKAHFPEGDVKITQFENIEENIHEVTS